MTAEIVKPTNKPTTTKSNRKLTPKQIKIIKTKQDHPELTTREVAAIADTSHSNVVACLNRYEINKANVIHYKDHRADILADLQHRLLASVTDDEIKKAPLGTKVLAACQLVDKERTERGLSNQNIQLIHADIAKIKGIQKQE